MDIICGLGNPGTEYAKTRHNVGFLFVENLAAEMRLPLNQFKHGGIFGRGNWRGYDVALFQPQSYMNLSGGPVGELLRFYKLETLNLICVCDDLDQAPMAVKVRKGGGHGGNNGLRDILRTLPDDGFHRIKIGIGKPNHKSATADWVLSNFSASELDALENEVFPLAKDRLLQILKQIQKAQD